MKSYGVTIPMKATEQYFPVVLFIMLYKMVLTFESVDEILWCDHSNESYWAVLSCGTIYYAVQCVLNYASVDKIMKSDHSNCRLRAVSLFSWSVEQNARDTQMTARVTEGARRERPLPPSLFASRGFAAQRSRTRALPLLNLKKKSLLAVYSNWSYWAVLSCDTV